ncbi:MAG: 2-phospho-L-lactate guanylyltransferase [Alphaproteobacteria bacterium HGW-Alphaproteobacteria-13]|jgi:2-phospho-L-lactate guanylyltransferase|nr:MAG: 2-phospho-L-lactate guanylyltransferase [Alphaproteobacteria bacterium HGW-Alphaproteobacteria-13]
MTPRIIIAARPFEEGKARLSAALSPAARARLNRRLFDHVLAAAGPERCIVVSRSAALLDRARAAGATGLAETGTELNAALTEAAAAAGEGPLLALSTDLPLLTPADIAAMIEAGASADIVAAPDASGTGTNALLMARPGLIPYRYGPGSFTAHQDAARRAGLHFARIDRPGLAQDIDTPADLARLPPDFRRP